MEREEEDVKDELELKVLQALSVRPEGLPDQEFDKVLPLSQEEKIKAINSLLTKNRIALMETNAGGIVYKYQSKDKADKYKELTSNETPIYQLLEEAGNKGLSVHDIKARTGIITTRINKLIGSMEGKGLVKPIKSIQGRRKKVYMLAELEPSVEVTGGIWREESNTGLIDVMYEKCLEYIGRQGTASRKEVVLHIKGLGLGETDIKEENVQEILNILLFDDKIEIIKGTAAALTEGVGSTLGTGKLAVNYMYRVKKKYVPDVALLHIPCTYCPLIKECNPDGLVTPKTCQYLKDWLGPDNGNGKS